MSKKILFCSLFILIFLMPSKQDSNAETWERHNTTVDADSILAAIDRGDSVIIDSCEIYRPLVRRGTRARLDTIVRFLQISESIFYDTVAFDRCYFMEDLNFHWDSLSGEVSFRHTNFGGDTRFEDAAFGGKGGFEDATFRGNANFWSATFHTTASFSSATFGRHALFDFATFGRYAGFRMATFQTTASFSPATFGAKGEFGDATFDTTASFLLATFDTVFFFLTKFGKQVDLRGMQFKEIEISWKQLEGRVICDNRTSYKLMKNFEEKRQLDDADGVYLFLKDQEKMERSPWVRYPEYWFVYLTCGYGRKPLNTFILSAVLVLLFAFFFTNSKAIKEIERDFRHRRRPRIFREIPKNWRKRFYYALYFSLHTFIIGVVSDWHATDEFLINTKRIKRFRFRTLSMIEGALGWILVIILIISLERTIGR